MEKFDAAIQCLSQAVTLLFLYKPTQEQSVHPLHQILQRLPVSLCIWSTVIIENVVQTENNLLGQIHILEIKSEFLTVKIQSVRVHAHVRIESEINSYKRYFSVLRIMV